MVATGLSLHGCRACDPEILTRRFEAYERRVAVEVAGNHPLKGKIPRPGDILLRSNDYLGLSGHPLIIGAEIKALREVGHGDIAARTWSQDRDDLLRQFEQKLARLMDAEDAVLCSAGYTANVGLVQALAGSPIPLYFDMKAHMSFWEGAKSAQCQPQPFRHNSPEHLARLLRKHGPGLIVVDALYSTDGAICPLRDIVGLAEEHGSILVVDETHSFGTIGASGAGLAHALGLSRRVHFRTVGLSKAAASRGGAVICSARAAEYFRNSALPQIFSTSVMQHEAAGYSATLEIFASEAWRQRALHANHAYLRNGLGDLGYNVDASDAQIIALEAGELQQTIILRDALEARGVFGAIFFPPATPQNRCLMRLSMSSLHRKDELDAVLRVCRDIRDEIGMAQWRSTLRRRGRPSQAAALLAA